MKTQGRGQRHWPQGPMVGSEELQLQSSPSHPRKPSFPLGISSSVAREMSLAWKAVAGRGVGLALVPGASAPAPVTLSPW